MGAETTHRGDLPPQRPLDLDDYSESTIGHDDYTMSRVPMDKRYSWVTMAVQRFGMLSALAQFMLSVMLGLHMRFWDAMAAVVLGVVVLEIATIFIGIAGQREGLNTSLLGRWAGFGVKGAALVGLLIAVTSAGWFGFQNEVFAAGIAGITGTPPWIWAIVGGALVTWLVIRGIAALNWVAYVTVPAFLLLVTYTVGKALMEHPLGELMTKAPAQEEWTLAAGTTIVAGGFIIGATFTPDLSRFNRTPADVVKQTVIGVTLGEFYVSAIGVLLAHTLKSVADTNDALKAVNSIIISGVGVLGIIILCLSIVKVNDWNLYPASLGVVNAIEGLGGPRLHRTTIALALGGLGTLLSAIGIAQKFGDFLGMLGIFLPPVAAIMIADYFILKTWRGPLDESRARGTLPTFAPQWNPASLIAWFFGIVIGWMAFGGKLPGQQILAGPIADLHLPIILGIFFIPSVLSFLVSMIAYVVLGTAGLVAGPRGPAAADMRRVAAR